MRVYSGFCNSFYPVPAQARRLGHREKASWISARWPEPNRSWFYDMDETNRVALVTGGARGIGRAIALGLARPGLTIYLNDVALGEDAAATQRDVEAKGAAAHLVAFNVADAAAVTKAVDGIIKESGRLDILVNNAGITRDNLILRMKEDEWDAVLAGNH